MGFPTVSASDSTSGTIVSNSTSWVLTYPANIAAGDLLIGFVGTDGNPTQTWPGSWIGAGLAGDGTASLGIRKLKAAGTESGTFTVTLAAGEQGCWRVIRIPAATWEGTIGTAFGSTSGANDGSVTKVTSANGSGTAPDPASLDPNTWATEDTLWIAAACSDHGATTYTGFPANYTQEDHSTAGGHAAESGGSNGAGMGIAYRKLSASSEDPGAFTTDASEGWGAATVAIRGTAATKGYPFKVPYLSAIRNR